mmetsp:Transcript_25227/g.49288  ORF Transcript_25227/g.49288 Transcript_25227/m.49288 type:complete len:512 (+) Transcript_25227:2699-4234(+)
MIQIDFPLSPFFSTRLTQQKATKRNDHLCRRDRDNLVRIQNVLRVQRHLQFGHQVHCRSAQLCLQVFLLAQSDAVLSCASAFHLDRPIDHALIQSVCLMVVLWVLWVEHDHDVEVRVTHMTHDRGKQRRLVKVLLSRSQTVSKTGDGDSNVGCHQLLLRLLCLGCPECGLAGPPDCSPLCLVLGPPIGFLCVLAADLLHLLNVMLDVLSGPCEFEQDERGLLQARPCIGVAGIHHDLIQQLDGSHLDSLLENLDHRVGGVTHCGKVHVCDLGALRNIPHLQGGLSDDPQSSLRPHEQTSKVVPCRALARSLGGLHNRSVCHHHSQVHHLVLHCAVPDSVCARAAGAAHPSDLGTWARVDSEEKPMGLENIVQLHPPDTGLDHDVHVFLVDLQDLVQVLHRHRHPPSGGDDVTLQRGPCCVGHHGHSVLVADLHDLRDLLCGVRVHNRLGVGSCRIPTSLLPVFLQFPILCRVPVPHQFLQFLCGFGVHFFKRESFHLLPVSHHGSLSLHGV